MPDADEETAATMKNIYDWKIWKHITLGTNLHTPAAFKKAFRAKGCRMGVFSDRLIDSSSFQVATEKMELPLILVSEDELNFTNAAGLSDILERGQKNGLRLCPFETALQLRLRFQEQPVGQLYIYRYKAYLYGFWARSTPIPTRLR